MNTKSVQFLKSDFTVTKTDKWENYYIKQRQKYLVLLCLLSIVTYFTCLLVFKLYGIPFSSTELRGNVLDSIDWFKIALLLLIVGLLCNITIILINKSDSFIDNKKDVQHKISLKQYFYLCKTLFCIGNILIALSLNVVILNFPIKIVILSLILTFGLYIICVIFGTFMERKINQYYVLIGELIFSFLVLQSVGIFHSKWYFIITSIIGIIFDSLFVLFAYNEMQYMTSELSEITKKLSDSYRKKIYDIEIMQEVSFLFLVIYNMIMDFCNLLMGSLMDD